MLKALGVYARPELVDTPLERHPDLPVASRLSQGIESFNDVLNSQFHLGFISYFAGFR